MKNTKKYFVSTLFASICTILITIKDKVSSRPQKSLDDKQEIKNLVNEILPETEFLKMVCCDSFSTQFLSTCYYFFCIAFHHNKLYFIPIKKYHKQLKYGIPKVYSLSDFGKITFRFKNSNVIFFDHNDKILYNLSIPNAYRGYASHLCPFVLEQEKEVKTFIHFIKRYPKKQ